MQNDDISRLLHAVRMIDLSAVIPVIEQGLEIQKMHYAATRSDESLRSIKETQMLLSFFYIRRIKP